MAKARASGTPAKASRKASPAKSKAASPTRVTRSSPRRAVPSAKAQEAAVTDDRVQTGRVTKKASPSKATTPVKKTSPAKASPKKASPAKAKTTTPAKKGKTSTTKSSPTKTPPLGMYSAEAREELLRVSPYHRQQVAMEQLSKDSAYCAREMASHMRTYSPEKTLDVPMISTLDICRHYATLAKFKESLDGNARKADDENTRNTRPLYRKLKKAMAALLGDGLNECLKQDVSAYAFTIALAEGLRRNGVGPDGTHDVPYFRVPRDMVPSIRVQEAKERHNKFELTKRIEALTRLSEERGIPVPPMGPPASRSKSPSKGLGKGQGESSVSSPVRTRSKSPAKAAARTRASSKSPAPIVNPKTRSKSPAKKASSSAAVPAQDTTSIRQTRSRSKSPAVDNAAYTTADDEDDEPASPQGKKPAPKSPAKKRAAPTPVRSPSPPKKARSASPAKTKTTGKTKPSPSPPAPTPARGPSPSKKAKAASAAKSKPTTKPKTTPSPAPPSPKPQPKTKPRSKSPAKPSPYSHLPNEPPTRSPKRKSSTTSSTQPYKRPHPSQPARGKIISPTNPQTIPSLNNKPNPFHETLPAPEIWHRRMPPYFPFGETPYMEKELGREMAEDLKRGAEDKALRQQSRSDPTNGGGSLINRVASLASSAADAVRSTFSSPPKAAVPKKYPSMWDLPDVYGSDKAKRAERGGYQNVVDLAGSSSDDGYEDEDGDEYMTGGLH